MSINRQRNGDEQSAHRFMTARTVHTKAVGWAKTQEAPNSTPGQWAGPFLVPDFWRKAASLTERDNNSQAELTRDPLCTTVSSF